jgi:MFS family permease
MQVPVNRNRLFLASCIALVVTSMTFALRAKLELVFREGIGLTAEELGFAFGPAFFGFTLAMIIGGPLVDLFGMKRILGIAFAMHALGITVTLLATDFWTLFAGTLGIGIGNGMVEAACNPLVTTLFPQQKTKMLNRFHVWFPGGIVIGSLLAYVVMDVAGLSWQILIACLYLPLAVYGFLFLKEKLPQTERVSMGISSTGMWKAVVTPLFLFMAFCMILTASTELGTTQRINALLPQTEVSGILVLAFINGLMAIGRAFAGPVVHRLNTTGMLLLSAVFSCLGLLWLSSATGYTTFAAAGVFAVGVCYFWPTMLSFVSEKIPESGALGLAIMGGLGMFSVSIVLPIMGGYMDAGAGQGTLRMVAIHPAILIVLFGGLLWYMRTQAKQETTPASVG